MLVPYAIRLRHGSHHHAFPRQRRQFMQGLCDGFLDLAMAIPFPPSLPPYSATIILVTLATRTALLPIVVWGRRRVHRVEEVVLPQVEKLKPVVSKQVLEDMKREGIRGDRDTLQSIHTQRSIALLTAHRKALFAEHHCNPLPSIIIPPLSQLPFFVVTTIALGRLSVDPTPFDSESFLTLTTLAHPDPTMTLPIILGVLTMANVESSNWVMSAAERERARHIEHVNEKKRAELGAKARLIQPQKVIKFTVRFLSVVRIIVGAMAPGHCTLLGYFGGLWIGTNVDNGLGGRTTEKTSRAAFQDLNRELIAYSLEHLKKTDAQIARNRGTLRARDPLILVGPKEAFLI